MLYILNTVPLKAKAAIFAPMKRFVQHINTWTEVGEDAYVAMDTILDKYLSLIVWNDEINSFEWVIETLIEVCQHTQEQAEQCALIIHTKGKYAVKNGDYDTLSPMRDAITERGIGATIE